MRDRTVVALKVLHRAVAAADAREVLIVLALRRVEAEELIIAVGSAVGLEQNLKRRRPVAGDRHDHDVLGRRRLIAAVLLLAVLERGTGAGQRKTGALCDRRARPVPDLELVGGIGAREVNVERKPAALFGDLPGLCLAAALAGDGQNAGGLGGGRDRDHAVVPVVADGRNSFVGRVAAVFAAVIRLPALDDTAGGLRLVVDQLVSGGLDLLAVGDGQPTELADLISAEAGLGAGRRFVIPQDGLMLVLLRGKRRRDRAELDAVQIRRVVFKLDRAALAAAVVAGIVVPDLNDVLAVLKLHRHGLDAETVAGIGVAEVDVLRTAAVDGHGDVAVHHRHVGAVVAEQLIVGVVDVHLILAAAEGQETVEHRSKFQRQLVRAVRAARHAADIGPAGGKFALGLLDGACGFAVLGLQGGGVEARAGVRPHGHAVERDRVGGGVQVDDVHALFQIDHDVVACPFLTGGERNVLDFVVQRQRGVAQIQPELFIGGALVAHRQIVIAVVDGVDHEAQARAVVDLCAEARHVAGAGVALALSGDPDRAGLDAVEHVEGGFLRLIDRILAEEGIVVYLTDVQAVNDREAGALGVGPKLDRVRTGGEPRVGIHDRIVAGELLQGVVQHQRRHLFLVAVDDHVQLAHLRVMAVHVVRVGAGVHAVDDAQLIVGVLGHRDAEGQARAGAGQAGKAAAGGGIVGVGADRGRAARALRGLALERGLPTALDLGGVGRCLYRDRRGVEHGGRVRTLDRNGDLAVLDRQHAAIAEIGVRCGAVGAGIARRAQGDERVLAVFEGLGLVQIRQVQHLVACVIAAEERVGCALLFVDRGKSVEVHFGRGGAALDGLAGHIRIHLVHPPCAVGLVGVGCKVAQVVAHVPEGKTAARLIVLEHGNVLDQARGVAEVLVVTVFVGANLVVSQTRRVADAADRGNVAVHGVEASVRQTVERDLIGRAVVFNAPGNPLAEEIHLVIGKAGAAEPGFRVDGTDGLDKILPRREPDRVGDVPGVAAVVGLVEDVVHAVAGQTCLDAFFRHLGELSFVQLVVGGALERAFLVVPVCLDVRAADLDPLAAGFKEGFCGQHRVAAGVLQAVGRFLLKGVGTDRREQVGRRHVLLADAVQTAHGKVADLVVLGGEIRCERGPAGVILARIGSGSGGQPGKHKACEQQSAQQSAQDSFELHFLLLLRFT